MEYELTVMAMMMFLLLMMAFCRPASCVFLSTRKSTDCPYDKFCKYLFGQTLRNFLTTLRKAKAIPVTASVV
jgi:hypothetical protein